MRSLLLAVGVGALVLAWTPQRGGAQTASCGDCEQIGCRPGWVLISPNPSGGYHVFGGSRCIQDPCPATGCQITRNGTEVQARILAAVDAQDADALVRIAREEPGVHLNFSRQAVQVGGCTPDIVIMHVKLPQKVLARLSRLLQNERIAGLGD